MSYLFLSCTEIIFIKTSNIFRFGGMMPLIPCRSCEKPLSQDAKICPNCGAKKPTKHKKPTDFRRLGKLLLILLVVYIEELAKLLSQPTQL